MLTNHNQNNQNDLVARLNSTESSASADICSESKQLKLFEYFLVCYSSALFRLGFVLRQVEQAEHTTIA